MAAVFSFETSAIYEPVRQRHVPDERKPQKQLRFMLWFDKALTLKGKVFNMNHQQLH
jgi:hypothetical protein